MRFALLAAVLFATGMVRAQAPAVDSVQDAEEHTLNANERYGVANIEVTGIDDHKISRSVREEMRKLIGQPFSQSSLDRIKSRLAAEFPDYSVHEKVSRADRPNFVKVILELRRRSQRNHFDLTAPKALYASNEGWTGEVDGKIQAHTSTFLFGVLSDGDSLIERYAGIRARYENSEIGTRRVRLAFEFDSLHEIWNRATLEAASDGAGRPLGIYRTRQNFAPMMTLALTRDVQLNFGTSFQRFQVQYPAAHTEASNAVVTTLRYDRQLEESGPNKHRLEAGYNLRAATRVFDSDYVYARHSAYVGYTFSRGHHKLSDHAMGGALSGYAPIFDRFALGNSTTLRGWSKYEIAPAGADRMAHNSVEYRYRAFEMFYDTGAVWSRSETATVRHSAGAGLHIGDLALLIAFPIRSGRAEAVFIAGLNL